MSSSSDKPAKSANSSYQNLLEGKCEMVVTTKDEQYQCNVSELLRDLYQKHYATEKQLAQLIQAATPGAPPVE
jgi:hypothetical protein